MPNHPTSEKLQAGKGSLHASMYRVIFLSDTPSGRNFDLALIAAIVISVLVVMLDSVESLQVHYGQAFLILEWALTALFTVEYVARLWCVARPWTYVFSFYGLIDLLAIVPTYLALLFPGTHYLVVVRSLRLLRVFRVLRLMTFVHESRQLSRALWSSRHKIFIFLFVVATLAIMLGSVMYVVEGPEHGFTSIPRSIYWTIVTITTVGYGDIAPQTTLGQALAALAMFTGYAIIAVPTGIVTSELQQAGRVDREESEKASAPSQPRHQRVQCVECDGENLPEARFCMHCGAKLG